MNSIHHSFCGFDHFVLNKDGLNSQALKKPSEGENSSSSSDFLGKHHSNALFQEPALCK